MESGKVDALGVVEGDVEVPGRHEGFGDDGVDRGPEQVVEALGRLGRFRDPEGGVPDPLGFPALGDMPDEDDGDRGPSQLDQAQADLAGEESTSFLLLVDRFQDQPALGGDLFADALEAGQDVGRDEVPDVELQ